MPHRDNTRVVDRCGHCRVEGDNCCEISAAARAYVQSLIRLRDCDGGSFHERIFARDSALRELFVACGEADV